MNQFKRLKVYIYLNPKFFIMHNEEKARKNGIQIINNIKMSTITGIIYDKYGDTSQYNYIRGKSKI